jgi:hypothetical protein
MRLSTFDDDESISFFKGTSQSIPLRRGYISEVYGLELALAGWFTF